MKINWQKQSIALALAATVVVAGCAAKPEATTGDVQETVTPVQIETVKTGTILTEAGFSAKLAPSQEVQVSPKMSGKLTALPVKLGQYVKQGDVLFSLDEQDLRNSIEQAEASYQFALANLNQTKNSSSQGLEQARNGLKQAEQALADARLNQQRMQQLFKEGAVSSQQNEQAASALTNAQTAYANAQQALQAAQQMSGIQVSDASVKQAAVGVENARTQLANASVKSPISGYVSNVHSAVGQIASPQAPVVTIVNTNPLLVKANLSEQEIISVKIGTVAKVDIPAFGKVLDAKVTAVSPVMDTQLKAYPIEITIPNASNELKADMVVNVKFPNQPNTAANKLIVPRKAVFDQNGKQYVFIVSGETAKQVEVATGESSSDEIEIVNGLTKEDHVVVKGQTLLKDGSKVKVQQQ